MTKLMTLFFILFSINSFASLDVTNPEWSHVKLQSIEGVQINIDHQLLSQNWSSNKPAYNYRAVNTYINVFYPGISENAKVRVVVVNFKKIIRRYYEPSSDKDFSQESSETYDLDWKDGHFSKKINDLNIYNDSYGFFIQYRQEIAVVIDGVWLKDPMTKTNNFGLQLKNSL